jgi:hypothetical protein
MSRSLNRIRSLVSEIEQIQKRGQLGESLQMSQSAIAPTPPLPPMEAKEEVPVQISAPTQAAAPVIPLPERKVEAKEGRVSVRLSGSVVLDLQIEDSGERVELRRLTDGIEIRFSDGKAFHIPFQAVA